MTRDELLQPPDYVHTLPNTFRNAVEKFGSRTMVVCGDRRLTFQEMEQQSAILARHLLASGVGKGARIGLLMPNTPEWGVAFMAITRIGAVAVLISTLYQRRELAWVARYADLHGLMMADAFLNHDYVARLEEVAPEIREQSSERPLLLEELPYLRTVYVWGDNIPAWAVDGRALLRQEPEGVGESLLRAVEDNVTPADFAVLIFTSGTTADPKGVMHSHGAIVRRSHATRSGRGYTQDSRILVLGAMCWVAGLNPFCIAWHVGASVVTPVTPKIEDVAAVAIGEDVTFIAAQPAILKQLQEYLAAAQIEQGPALKLFYEGPRDQDGELLPEGRWSRGLGMTETVAMHSFEPYGCIPADKAGAFGRSVPDIERVIRDFNTGEVLGPNEEGQLWMRGPGVMLGLYKKERHEVFGPDGFYATGDICRIDEDGYLYFRGRNSEMIKTTGANVSPREVELALEAYPDVREAGVFGMPGEGRDEIVVAVVSPKGEAKLDPEELRRRLRQDISSFKTPKVIHIVPMEYLPRTGSAKLNKRAVKETLLRGEPLIPPK